MFRFGRSWNRPLTFLWRRLFKSRFTCLFRPQGALLSLFRLPDLALSICHLLIVEEEVRRSTKVILSPGLKLFLSLLFWVSWSSGLPLFDWDLFTLWEVRRDLNCVQDLALFSWLAAREWRVFRIEWDPLGRF